MTATVSANGLLEIPVDFLEEDGIKPGQQYEVERLGKGLFRLKEKKETGDKPQQTLVDWILSCPEKDWFVEPVREKRLIERSTLFDE